MFDARLARNAPYSMIQAFVHVLSFLSVVATFSPEQIAGRLHLELSYAPVSCSTIYRAIHSGKLDCELQVYSLYAEDSDTEVNDGIQNTS